MRYADRPVNGLNTESGTYSDIGPSLLRECGPQRDMSLVTNGSQERRFILSLTETQLEAIELALYEFLRKSRRDENMETVLQQIQTKNPASAESFAK